MFDRSRVADRRLESATPGEAGAIPASGKPAAESAHTDDCRNRQTRPLKFDGARDFYISGELIATANNIYNSQSPGRWKQLELYLTPRGHYVCLEIWRTTLDGEHDQFWLVTCNNLKSAQEFFGNNWLACELFYDASLEPR
ncbi:MAG: hypothetical protein PVH38_01740 [Gammaproteobacteria bacterium]